MDKQINVDSANALPASICLGSLEHDPEARGHRTRHEKYLKAQVLSRDSELKRLTEENRELRAVVNDGARCFFGPDEQTPGTWGWQVAWKLQEATSKYPPL